MAKQFTPAEWNRIRETLGTDPKRYGLPQREYGSVLIGFETAGDLVCLGRSWLFLVVVLG